MPNSISKAAIAALLLIINCTLSIVNSNAQTIQRFDIGLNRVYTDSLVIENNDTLIYNVNWNQAQLFAVLDPDTAGISQLEVTLGTTEGGSDLLNKTFNSSQEGTFSDGTSFFHEGQVQRCNLGKFRHNGTYYATLRAKKNNSWSAPVTFQTNP